MPQKSCFSQWRFGSPVLIVVFALLLTLPLPTLFETTLIFSAWSCRLSLGAGVLATAMSTLAGNELLMPPLDSLNLSGSNLLSWGLLAPLALIIAMFYVRERQRHQQEETSCNSQLLLMDTILSASPDHFYMFDQDGRFIYASRAALEALGLDKSDIIGKTEQELGFPPEVIEPHKQRRKAVFATGETLRGETSLQGVDGVRYYEYILTPIPDASGKVQVVVVTARDVTQNRQDQEELKRYRNHLEQLVETRTAELSRTIEQLNQEILERQKVEVALRESESTLRSFFDSAPMMMGIVELIEDDILHISDNAATAKLFGLTPEVMQNKRASQMGAPQQQLQEWIERYREAERTQSPVRFEYLHPTTQGQRWLSATVSSIAVSSSNRPRFAYLVEDISDRKRVEKALQESEERWHLALRGNNDGIWDWNIKTNEVFFSARWKQMLGYEEHEIANHLDEWSKRVHPDDISWVTQVIQDHFAKKTPFYISEHRVLCKDGTYKWILDRGQALWDEQGNPVRMAGSHTDITDRKQAEQELLRQTQYRQLLAEVAFRIRQSLQIEVILQTTVTELQQLLQADRVLFYRLLPGCNGKVLAEAVLPQWESILGRELIDHCFEDEYLQQYQQEIHAWSDVEQAGFQPCHLEMLRQFSIRANLIVSIRLKDKIWGMLFVHQCSAPREWNPLEVELLRQLADQLSIALAQAQTLEQATRYSQELARSNRELEQFAYVASHDLQEPLRTLASYAKLLSRRYSSQLDEKANRFIQYMVEEALRMQALINDLLKYSRVGRQVQTFASVNCTAVFDIVVSRLQEAITNSGANVTRGELPTIMADETQMVQLLQNLISNAIKYRSLKPPVVQVAAERQEGQWLFWVRDNGIGIAPKYAERIFAIFQRLHTQEEYPGNGIGLAIAAKIVERHGGRIWVESEPEQGATFYFTIPDQGVSTF